MNKRNWILVGSGALLVAVVVAMLLLWDRSSGEGATVRIGYLNITASLPLFIAEEKGFFVDEGLDVQSVQLGTSNSLVDGVIAGNLEAFIEASAVPVLAVELQAPGRLKVFSVSAITSSAPFDSLLVKQESAFDSLDDLEGANIGVFPGSTATNLLRKFLEDSGYDVSDMTFVPIPPQNHLTALLEGSVDVIHAYEPTTAIAISRGGVRQLYGSVYAEMIDRNPQGVAALSAKFMSDSPDSAKKVVRALERAMMFMSEHEDEARQILAERMKLEPAVANKSVFLYMLPHEDIDSQIFQDYADMLNELGELQGKVDVNDLLYSD